MNVAAKRAQRSIPLHRPPIGRREAKAAADAVLAGHIVGRGPIGAALEERMTSDLGAGHALLTTSGSHALELACAALGLRPGDEVVLPSFTFSSVANAVLRQGAKPVFADVRRDTLNLDLDDVARRLTRRTKAVIAVHYAGVATDMAGLAGLTRPRGIRIIEDAAHAVGASWRGRQLGTIGDAGCFSFHATKNITCGEGGAFLTNSGAFARRAEFFREKGTNRSAFLRGEIKKYTWVSEGSSFVLSDVLAAILAQQWPRREEINAKRGRLHDLYIKALKPLEAKGLLRLPIIPADCRSSYHLFHVVLPSRRIRETLSAALKAKGVGATFHYQPLHASPFGRRELGCKSRLPVSEWAGEGLLRLPLYSELPASDVAYVCEAVTAALRKA